MKLKFRITAKEGKPVYRISTLRSPRITTKVHAFMNNLSQRSLHSNQHRSFALQ